MENASSELPVPIVAIVVAINSEVRWARIKRRYPPSHERISQSTRRLSKKVGIKAPYLADDFVRDLTARREVALESVRWIKKTSGRGASWISNRREPDDAETRRLRYIEEAIRRDLPFLVKHPGSLFQTLWNALWWRDYEGLHRHCDAHLDRSLREKFMQV